MTKNPSREHGKVPVIRSDMRLIGEIESKLGNIMSDEELEEIEQLLDNLKKEIELNRSVSVYGEDSYTGTVSAYNHNTI